MRLLPAILAGLWVSASASRAETPTPTASGSDVLKVKRPKGGEWFGLYLIDKKVGYVFQDVTLEPGHPDQVRSVQQIHFHASVSNQISDRFPSEVHVYENKPRGRLLTFKVEDKGDGGDQLLEGTCTPAGL